MKFCKQCGEQLDDNAMFCAKCGATVEDNDAASAAMFDSYSMGDYAGGGFAESFRNKIGNSVFFMVAIILSSAGVFLQLICNFSWLSYPSFGNILLLLGTLFGAGVAIAALWFTFIASKKPGFPIGYNITFLVLKIFFIASLAWTGIWFISDMVDVVNLLDYYYSTDYGVLLLLKTLVETATTILYLVFALLFAIKMENNFKTDSGDMSDMKKFAIMSFVHAGGLIIGSFFVIAYADVLYTLSTWTIAAASILYGVIVLKNASDVNSTSDSYRPY